MPGACVPTIQTRRIIMAFRPLHDRVVVRRIEADEKTAASFGGILCLAAALDYLR